MPTIESRLSGIVGEPIPVQNPAETHSQPTNRRNTPNVNIRNIFSPTGNPSPNRGLVPLQYMYDFDINHFLPDSPTFTRSLVGIRALTQNLALQATTK